MKKFTEFDKELARHIDKKYKWIARNVFGKLYLFEDKPFKKQYGWDCEHKDGGMELLTNYNVLEAIRWRDDEPTLIKDIYDPHILNEAEEEYLKAVLRPFRNRVSQIIKKRSALVDEEFIVVNLTDYADSFTLPYFKENKMYIGMERGYPYSLRELGITYD